MFGTESSQGEPFMDKSIAILIATLIGGLISSVTSYLVTKQSLKNKLKEMSVERILSAIENIEIFVIRVKSGVDLDQNEINQFIANCTWLPDEVKEGGLLLAKNYMENGSTDGANDFHKMLTNYKRTHILLD